MHDPHIHLEGIYNEIYFRLKLFSDSIVVARVCEHTVIFDTMEFQNNLQELFFKPVTANNNDDICIEIVNNSLLPSRFYGEKSDIW